MYPIDTFTQGITMNALQNNIDEFNAITTRWMNICPSDAPSAQEQDFADQVAKLTLSLMNGETVTIGDEQYEFNDVFEGTAQKAFPAQWLSGIFKSMNVLDAYNEAHDHIADFVDSKLREVANDEEF